MREPTLFGLQAVPARDGGEMTWQWVVLILGAGAELIAVFAIGALLSQRQYEMASRGRESK